MKIETDELVTPPDEELVKALEAPVARGRYEAVTRMNAPDGTQLTIYRHLEALPNGPDMECINFVCGNILALFKMRDIFDSLAMLPGIIKAEIFDAQNQGVVMHYDQAKN